MNGIEGRGDRSRVGWVVKCSGRAPNDDDASRQLVDHTEARKTALPKQTDDGLPCEGRTRLSARMGEGSTEPGGEAAPPRLDRGESQLSVETGDLAAARRRECPIDIHACARQDSVKRGPVERILGAAPVLYTGGIAELLRPRFLVGPTQRGSLTGRIGPSSPPDPAGSSISHLLRAVMVQGKDEGSDEGVSRRSFLVLAGSLAIGRFPLPEGGDGEGSAGPTRRLIGARAAGGRGTPT